MMEDSDATKEALKSLRRELRDRTGKNKIFQHVVVSVEGKKKDDEEEETGVPSLHGEEIMSSNSGSAE